MAIFKSKAHTLLSLKLKRSIIPKIYIVKFDDYKKKKDQILQNIKNRFLNSKIAIRSSFENEDTAKNSNAGKYESFLNLDSCNYKDIDSKIKRLIKLKKIVSSNEHFFVQKMIKNLSFSGVVLTRNLEDYSKCININYYNGNNTEAVTSGKFKTETLIYIENKIMIEMKY